jgi:hypothetical protein
VTDTADERDELADLQSATDGLSRRGSIGVELWLPIAGSVLVPLGVVLILLGYRGAANAPRVIQQVPYEISGGMLGLACVFGGGFAYFAHWLYRIVQEQRATAARIDAQTVALVAELAALRAALAGGHELDGAAAAPSGLVRTRSGSLVHRAGCQVLGGRPTRPARLGDGPPCKACRPSATSR